MRATFKQPKPHRCPGVTMLEILVVLTVLGMLAALLIPAVQRVRESSRRTQCMNNLRQIGVAIGAFESTHRRLPQVDAFRTCIAYDGSTSFHAELLPWLDQTPLAEQVAAGCPFPGLDEVPPADSVPYWTPVALQRIDLFLCPSDPVRHWGNNYRFCSGTMELTVPDGAFGRKEKGGPIRISDVTDGLSNTAAVSEKLKSPLSEAWNPRTDFWFTGLWSSAADPYPPAAQLLDLCGALSRPPIAWQPYAGYTWLTSGGTFTEYNHIAGPNPNSPDCDVHRGGPGSWLFPTAVSAGVRSATSEHPGGVNLLFLDGRCQFVSDQIDLSVWRAAGTRAGRDD